MGKILNQDDDIYSQFKAFAESDNRSFSNFIETSPLRYISESEYIDEFYMAVIDGNEELQAKLKRAFSDAKIKKHYWVIFDLFETNEFLKSIDTLQKRDKDLVQDKLREYVL